MQGAVVTPLAPAQNVSRVHASTVERPPETTSEARTLIITMYTVKKGCGVPSPAGMSLANLSPAMESLVSVIPAGYEKTANLFLQCTHPCVAVNINSDLELLSFLAL